MQSCEDNWKSQYEKVVKENEALHNRGGDTLMAAQWRGRYDDLLREKEGKFRIQEAVTLYCLCLIYYRLLHQTALMSLYHTL